MAVLRLAALYVVAISFVLILFYITIILNRLYVGIDLADLVSSRRVFINEVAQSIITSSTIIVAGMVFSVCVATFLLACFAFRRIDEVTRMQHRFIAETSHEMRTPLSIMKTGIEVSLMNKNSLTREEAVEVLETNLQEVNNMARMINALLVLSRFDDPSRSAQLERINITDIVSAATLAYEKAAESKQITMHLPDAPAYTVVGNSVHLGTMFKQIIRNAVAYTEERGSIQVRIAPSFPKRVRVSIQDTGIGIDAKDIPHIFEPFYRARDSHELLTERHRANNPSTKKPVGLGLALVKKIVKQHRGTVRVHSEVKKGSTFFVTLPLV